MFNRRRQSSFTIDISGLSVLEVSLGAAELTLLSGTAARFAARRLGHCFITELQRRCNGSSSNGIFDIRLDDLDEGDLLTAQIGLTVLVESTEKAGLKDVLAEILLHLSNEIAARRISAPSS